MDHIDVGKMWDENAEAWTKLSRLGYDVFRDRVNTPAFLAMLPDISGLSGLDIGCGEGHNTRLFAGLGARVTAVDISEVFLSHAQEEERTRRRGIRYVRASAMELPFPENCFDFAGATMSLMDMPEHKKAVTEIFRVLKPGAFLQFSIIHPCFQTPRWKWVLNENGRKVAIECGDYFDPPDAETEEWIFPAAPEEFQRKFRKFVIPVFRRTLSSWLNLILDTGFSLDRFCEPYANEETARDCPDVAETRIVSFFLIIRCTKPL